MFCNIYVYIFKLKSLSNGNIFSFADVIHASFKILGIVEDTKLLYSKKIKIFFILYYLRKKNTFLFYNLFIEYLKKIKMFRHIYKENQFF